MIKHFSDIFLEIPTVLTRLTLLKRRLAGKKSLVIFASSDLGTSFSPQSAASNLPLARRWKRSFLNVTAPKSVFNSRNMRVIARSRVFPMRSAKSRFSGSRFSRMIFHAMKRFLVRGGNKTNVSAWEMKLVIRSLYHLLSSLDVLRNFRLAFETSSTTCVVTGLICSPVRAFPQVHPRNDVHSGSLLSQFFARKTWSASRNNSFVRGNASKAVQNNFFVHREGDLPTRTEWDLDGHGKWNSRNLASQFARPFFTFIIVGANFDSSCTNSCWVLFEDLQRILLSFSFGRTKIIELFHCIRNYVIKEFYLGIASRALCFNYESFNYFQIVFCFLRINKNVDLRTLSGFLDSLLFVGIYRCKFSL